MIWKIVIGVVAVFGLFAVKSVYDDRVYRKRLRYRMKREWGVLKEEEYSSEKMENIELYYRDHIEDTDIDDITWNDLNMDKVYQQLNHTQSAMGQEYLYALLRKPILSGEVLGERERLIRIFSEREEDRLSLQIQLSIMGKMRKFSVYQYLSNIRNLKLEPVIGHVIQMLALIACILLCIVRPAVMILPTIILVFYNMMTYYRRKEEMDRYYHLFGYIVRTVRFSKDVARLPIEGLEDYFETLQEYAGCFRKFCQSSWLVVGGSEMDGGILDSILDYVRMLFHIDIIKFQSMAKEVIRHEKALMALYETIGILDCGIAIASYREMKEDWCQPELLESKSHIFAADNLYHPLISEPVRNSISQEKCVLITGSNASGKSTFIKTVAINAIFAQTIHTVLADSYRANYYRIYSSMALRDDILSEESYYIVEIKSLKRIIDQAKQDGAPVLCFIDEVLRGTNTLERIASSSQILAMLAEIPAMCFAATHDIELTNILEAYYDNYHFQERIEENDVLFDYQLREGRAMTRNAIKLLGMIGYDADVIQRAEDSVQRFLKTGNWSLLQ